MIDQLTAVQFDRPATNGRTSPGFITCEDADGDSVEVVAKLSEGCDLGTTSLAIELFSACLAGGLGLPVPQPFLVDLDDDFIASISDVRWADLARRSSPIAFGSKLAGAGFGAWTVGSALLGDLTATAAGTILFDSIADNPDRRCDNPNCLQRGDAIRLIDHELCFSPVHIFGWRPPWMLGALHQMATPGAHIFREPLRRATIDWEAIKERWQGLSDLDLAEYAAAIPAAWAGSEEAIAKAVDKVRNARDNIAGCIVEVRRVLTC